MTNLTDLLPAGAGGKQVSFTASGAIAQGKPVILNTAGTVTEVAIASVTQGIGTYTNFSSGSITDGTAFAYSTTDDKLVVIFRDDSYHAYYAIGTYSAGTPGSYTWATAAKIRGSNYNLQHMQIEYHPSSDQFVMVASQVDDNYYGQAFVGEIDSGGTTMTWQAPVTFYTNAPNGCERTDITYDTNADKFLISYIDRQNDYLRYRVGSLSGSTISFGTELEVSMGGVTQDNQSTVYDSTAQKHVTVTRENSGSNRGYGVVATISGTSVTVGTEAQFDTSVTDPYIEYDPNADKCLIVFRDDGNSLYGTSYVATVSGTSISYSSAVVFSSAQSEHFCAVYDPTVKKIAMQFLDSGSNNNVVIECTISGTTASFANETELFDIGRLFTGGVYDPDAQVVAFGSLAEDTGSTLGTSKAYRTSGSVPNLTATNFIGIADAAISDTASGNITIKGGVASNGLSSLTPGSVYYVQLMGHFLRQQMTLV